MQKKTLLGCSIFILVPVLILFGVRAFLSRDLRAASAEYDQAVAEAKRAGLALKMEDVLPKPVGETENAAREYRALTAYDAEHRKENETAYRTLADLGSPSKTVSTADLKAALRQLEPFLAIVRRGANKPYCVFDRDWTHPYSVVLPEYAVMKQASRALIGSGWLAMREGRVGEGLDDLSLALKVARHATEEPILIALLVGQAIEILVLSAVTQIVAEMPVMASNRELRALVSQARPLPDLKRALSAELASSLAVDVGDEEMVKAMAWQEQGDRRDAMLKYVADGGTLNRAMHTRSLQFYTAAVKALNPDDPPGAYRALSDLSAEVARKAGNGQDLSYRLVGLVVPALEGLATLPPNIQAQRKLAGLYMDVLAYRNANRGWPRDLSVLKANATDPWTGRQFVYKVTADGFDLYSVGPNLSDDDGAPDDRGYFYPPRVPRRP